MKTAVLLLLATATATLAQGPLTPPGAPAPTQKSLQEIWDKVGSLQTQLTTAQSDITTLKSDNQLLTSLLGSAGVNFAWNIKTVDSAGNVGYDTSLAFGPDGQPAISYYNSTNGDLKFARFNGSTWAAVTVDSAGDVGYDTSLAFGPDGQPAISYLDNTNYDLKFARKGIFKPAP